MDVGDIRGDIGRVNKGEHVVCGMSEELRMEDIAPVG